MPELAEAFQIPALSSLPGIFVLSSYDAASAQAQAVAIRLRVAERFTAEANTAETLFVYERLLAARR